MIFPKKSIFLSIFVCLCTINGLNVSNLFRRVLCLTRKIEKGSGQVAVAVGILIQIVLMVFFCRIEIPKWQFLDSDRLRIKGLLFSKHLIDNILAFAFKCAPSLC